MMPRFSNGWVKLHRSLFQKFEHNFEIWGVFALLISWANIEKSSKVLKGQKIIIKRGQLVTSQGEIMKAANLSRSRVRTILKTLENVASICTEISQAGTVITILNYDKYQAKENVGNQQLTSQSPAVDQPLANQSPAVSHILKKEEKKKERKKEKRKYITPTLPDRELAESWIKRAGENMSSLKPDWNVENWAVDFAWLRVQGKIPLEHLEMLVPFFNQEDQRAKFSWSKNTNVPMALWRRDKNQKRRIENIIEAISKTQAFKVYNILEYSKKSDSKESEGLF